MSEENENNNMSEAASDTIGGEATSVTAPPSKDDTNMALLAHLLVIFTWFIGPLIVWLIKKEQGGFVEEQSREALNFSLTMTLALVASYILMLALIGFILAPIVCLLVLIFPIIAAVKSSSGTSYRYPLTIRMIK